MMDPDSPPDAKKQKLDLDVNSEKKIDSEIQQDDKLPQQTPTNESNISSDITPNKIKESCTSTDSERPVKETDVGITEFISQHDGFQGIIKQRYSDFLVHEINVGGERVLLTDIGLPTADQKQQSESNSTPDDSEVLCDEDKTQLQRLDEGNSKVTEVKIKAGVDKEARTTIHNIIRKHYGTLASRTETIDDTVYIVVSKATTGGRKSNQDARPPQRHDPWLHKGTDYCHCVLYKQNMDTMFCVSLIAKHLRLKPNMLTYAGTKDKRAKTCQQLCFYRVTAARLIALKHTLRDMALGNFNYCREPLKLGALKGNHFSIILRSVNGGDEQISSAMSSLRQFGFINYYGMQRFGTHVIPTHLVGRALLKSSWQEAIDLILKPRNTGYDPIHEARECWWKSRDAGKALRLIGKRSCPERYLLNGLRSKDNTDLVGALGSIPRNNLLMYIHAYQSYLWNKLVSLRIKEFGLQPIIGDLVIPHNITPDAADEEMEEGTGDSSTKKHIEPILVTSDNIAEFTIHDIVLPLVGHAIILPATKLAQVYIDWLTEDGLSLDALKARVKIYSLSGAYRHIMVCPRDLSYEIMRYDDPHLPLLLSDLEKLKGEQLPTPTDDGAHKALRLEFSLPMSTYATMAIREVLKQDTSASNQTSLTEAVMKSQNKS